MISMRISFQICPISVYHLHEIFLLTSFLCRIGDELEFVGGLGGSRFGFGGVTRKASMSSTTTQALGSELDENEEMEMS